MTKDSAKALLMQNHRFLQECLANSICVPQLLLREYSQIGLSDGEFIQLLRLMSLDSQGGINFEKIQAEFLFTEKETQAFLDAFIEKSLLTPNELEEGVYSLDGLINELFESWYFNKNCNSSKRMPKSATSAHFKKDNAALGKIYKTFEQEFGRGLSPIEGEQIANWFYGNPPELVEEALRRSVIQGKLSFSYIDKILLSWQQKNFHSLQEVNLKDQHPKNNKPAKKPKTAAPKNSEYNSVYDKLKKYQS